ncbi:MAG: hypothetical protein A3K45_02085 [Chloroflexi bacterium RIFOXYC12_FULL_59_14]|nr:MAG: hypothetical protein A3K45_02085 [Chloroflexi bacterium RIFOXYC12_FULL_59_14]
MKLNREETTPALAGGARENAKKAVGCEEKPFAPSLLRGKKIELRLKGRLLRHSHWKNDHPEISMNASGLSLTGERRHTL